MKTVVCPLLSYCQIRGWTAFGHPLFVAQTAYSDAWNQLFLLVESAGIPLAGRGCACGHNPFGPRNVCVAKPRRPIASVPDADSLPTKSATNNNATR